MKLHVKEWRSRGQRLPLPSGGEWENEPDKIQWVDEATGLDCLMHRSPSGAWCGYVGVPEGHPYFGKDYGQCTRNPPCEDFYCEHSPDSAVDVHGGLTYADFCQDTKDESFGICHVPEPGRPHRVWWLGFDCAHAGDLSPAHDALPGMAAIHGRYPRSDTYRNREYVENEVTKLAQQVASLALAKAP